MKTKILTLLLVSSIILCTNCDDDNQSKQVETLNQTWDLKNVSGGIIGVDIEYETGTVIWEFDAENETLTVTSSLTNDGPQSFNLPLQTGSYKYSLTESNGKTFIRIENFGIHTNGEYGSYAMDNGILTIDQQEGSESSANDVFVLLFE